MLGEKIRSLRKSKHLTLSELATMVSLSTGYISQVERGLLNPSMETLRKISSALGVSPYLLMESHSPAELQSSKEILIKKEDRISMKFPQSEIFYEIVSPLPQKNFTPSSLVTMFEIDPHGHDSKEFLSHDSEEIVVILEGEMDIIMEQAVYHLKIGDSLLIQKKSLHRSVNTKDIPVRGLCILCPLSWPFKAF